MVGRGPQRSARKQQGFDNMQASPETQRWGSSATHHLCSCLLPPRLPDKT